jgi:hypothetical protein
MITTKLIINALNENGENVTLFLDPSVSFVFKDNEDETKTFFTVSGIDGTYHTKDGDCTKLIDEIEEQMSDIDTEIRLKNLEEYRERNND